MKDSHGVDIQVGDTVMITAWGGNVRLTDVRRTGTVTALGRVRPVVEWHAKNDPPRGNVRTANLSVMRRDGAQGFEGNVGRAS